MSGLETLVVLFGLFVGYWVVTRFFTTTPPAAPPGKAAASGETAHSADPPRHWSAILGVSPEATREDLERARRELNTRFSPEESAALSQEVRELCARKRVEIDTAYYQALRERGAPAP